MNGLFDIIKELSHIDSVTGSEQKFAEKIKEMITADIRLFEDRLGNLVYSRGRDNSLLLAAHMDEPGIIATSGDGLVYPYHRHGLCLSADGRIVDEPPVETQSDGRRFQQREREFHAGNEAYRKRRKLTGIL